VGLGGHYPRSATVVGVPLVGLASLLGCGLHARGKSLATVPVDSGRGLGRQTRQRSPAAYGRRVSVGLRHPAYHLSRGATSRSDIAKPVPKSLSHCSATTYAIGTQFAEMCKFMHICMQKFHILQKSCRRPTRARTCPHVPAHGHTRARTHTHACTHTHTHTRSAHAHAPTHTPAHAHTRHAPVYAPDRTRAPAPAPTRPRVCAPPRAHGRNWGSRPR